MLKVALSTSSSGSRARTTTPTSSRAAPRRAARPRRRRRPRGVRHLVLAAPPGARSRRTRARRRGALDRRRGLGARRPRPARGARDAAGVAFTAARGSLNFAAPPPPRRPRAPLELVVCRARDARRCVRHMRRDLHCCAGCVDDPLAAYVRKTLRRCATATRSRSRSLLVKPWRAPSTTGPRGGVAAPRRAGDAAFCAASDGRVSPPRRVPGTPPVPTRPPRPRSPRGP